MTLFIYLASGVVGDVIDRDWDDPAAIPHFHHVCVVPGVLTAISSAFFVFFANSEINAILDSSVQDYY